MSVDVVRAFFLFPRDLLLLCVLIVELLEAVWLVVGVVVDVVRALVNHFFGGFELGCWAGRLAEGGAGLGFGIRMVCVVNLSVSIAFILLEKAIASICECHWLMQISG